MTSTPFEPRAGFHAAHLPLANASPRIRVFVVHNHPAYRFGLVSVLESESSLLCVGEAADLAEAVHTAAMLAPDVVVLDRNMPDAGDADAMNLLRAQLPLARLLVLASKFDPQANSGAPVLGACTVLPRSTSAADLVAAIETAFHSPSVPTTPRNGASLLNPPGSDLTQRERSLLALMARGLPNREICAQLGIAMPTVKFHVTNILAKLQVENRTSAVLVALRHKLVSID